jgi:predicted O-methyltransferase YrrM
LKFHYLKHFIKHYFTATLIDVLHSPFIFSLYQTCIKQQKDLTAFNEIENIRKQLLENTNIITYTDLGAGSNLLSSNIEKSIGSIAKTHLKPARIAQIIHRIVLNYKYKNIIELGTSLGVTSSYIASALKQNFETNEVNFTTIEGSSAIKQVANEQFAILKLSDYINSVEGNFNEQLEPVLNTYKNVDVFFVDGNHTYEATMKYFEKALQLAHNNSVFIFDDIYWSPGMTKAWEEIKQHSKVQQTVDLFFIGLVYFRTEQIRQHFKLRVI